MEFKEFVRKPFVVEAVEITVDNIAECAEFIGTLRYKEDKTPYIAVDRRLIPNVFQVHPGYWMTRMGDNIRCYSPKIFKNQFLEKLPEMDDAIKKLSGPERVTVPYIVGGYGRIIPVED
jgi:hypothetical protein